MALTGVNRAAVWALTGGAAGTVRMATGTAARCHRHVRNKAHFSSSRPPSASLCWAVGVAARCRLGWWSFRHSERLSSTRPEPVSLSNDGEMPRLRAQVRIVRAAKRDASSCERLCYRIDRGDASSEPKF